MTVHRDRMEEYGLVESSWDAIEANDFIIGCTHLRPGGDGLLTSVRVAVLDHSHCNDIKALLCKHCEAQRQRGRLSERTLVVRGLASVCLAAEIDFAEKRSA